jgi:hypothetical protein
MTEGHHEGGCLCGTVRYRVTGEPESANLCFCTQCQRQTGAPMAAFVSYPPERVALLAGQPAQFRASDRAVREFCPTCGSSLFWRPTTGETIDLYLGTFDDPGVFRQPDIAIWVQHRVPWLPDLPGITAYPERRNTQN